MRQQCLLAGFDKVVGASAAFLGDMGGFGGVAMLLSQGTLVLQGKQDGYKGGGTVVQGQTSEDGTPEVNGLDTVAHQVTALGPRVPGIIGLVETVIPGSTTCEEREQCIEQPNSYLFCPPILRACVSSFHIEYGLNSVVIIS